MCSIYVAVSIEQTDIELELMGFLIKVDLFACLFERKLKQMSIAMTSKKSRASN